MKHNPRVFAREARLAAFAVRLRAVRARRLQDRVEPGAAVVTATWNTRPYLAVMLRAINRQTPNVPVVVVDNASTDGTVPWLRREHPEAQVVALPRNVGHGLALDRGIHEAKREVVVCLDVDAFPISPRWVAELTEALDSGATFAGGFINGYIHPSYCAIRRDRFLSRGYSFDASYSRRYRRKPAGAPAHWDAGQLVDALDPGPHHHVEPSEIHGPRALGTIFGGLVYHHFYSTRLDTQAPEADVVRSGISPELSRSVWEDAVQRFAPGD